MEWMLRLVGTGIDGQSRSFDVMEISRPDGLGDIASLGLTLADRTVRPPTSPSVQVFGRCTPDCVSAREYAKSYNLGSITGSFRLGG